MGSLNQGDYFFENYSHQYIAMNYKKKSLYDISLILIENIKKGIFKRCELSDFWMFLTPSMVKINCSQLRYHLHN